MPDSMETNLCDFELFLSVMKNKEAHEITLGIIMEDPKLKLGEVHVEEVVLNKSGKRAIRLDAWSKDMEGTQYNIEMQNMTHEDDIRKRSRFYQSLIDSPILKSGKSIKYRQLPSTVVIFITQEDIFGENLAKYTFTEQCEEVEGLHLDDGTMKIFLNMESKNGKTELVSLLQYMKETHLDNPEILAVDEKIRKLDEIVTEVKESEEWEEIRMSLCSRMMELGLSQGREIGKEIGEESKVVRIICKKLCKGKDVEVIADEVEDDIDFVRKVVEFASNFAPNYDENVIVEAWMQMKESK